MTELSFLVELLLNHKLPKATQAVIKDRIKVVEANLPMQRSYAIPPITQQQTQLTQQSTQPIKVNGVVQSASTARILAEMAAEGSLQPNIQIQQSDQANQQEGNYAGIIQQPTQQDPSHFQGGQVNLQTQPAVVAQTPQAQAALAARQQSIAQSMSGKPMHGETRPRKF